MHLSFNNRNFATVAGILVIVLLCGINDAPAQDKNLPSTENKPTDTAVPPAVVDPTADDEKALESGNMEDKPVAVLQSLDKITARTRKFEASVGETVKFGSIYIMVKACKKAPPFEKPEASVFLQIWQKHSSETEENLTPTSEWIFSGWMFASSPALSAMDHPVYDVWVTDCIDKSTGVKPTAVEESKLSDKNSVISD